MYRSEVQRGRCRNGAIRLALMVTTPLGTAVLGTGPAAATNWIGTIGSWFTVENWSTGSVPATSITISNGGTAQITTGEAGSVEHASIAAGTVSVTGAGAKLSVIGHLSMGGAGPAAISVGAGGFAGAGSVTVNHGGAINLSGAGTSFFSSGLFTLATNGQATSLVSSGAVLDAGNSILGDGASARGTVTVTGAGSKFTNVGTLILGDAGTGILTIADGATARNTTGTIGSQYGSQGEVIVTGAGSAWTNTANLHVGLSGTGSLTISQGGSVTSVNGVIAENAGSEGSATVTGTGSKWTTATTYIGSNGTGTLVLSDGGKIENTTGLIGAAATGEGEATLSGAGTTWTNTNILSVGGSGKATLIVKDRAEVVAGTSGIIIAEGASSTGALTIGGREGAPAEAAGILTTSKINFGLGTGTIVLNHTNTDYTLGSAISGVGTIRHQSGTTTLTGDASAFMGPTTVSGGTLIVGNGTSGALGGAINVGANATLGGTGNLGSTSIAAGGTHAPGNSIGTQTIGYSYTNHGRLVIEATPLAADKLVVNGTVDITGAALDLQLSGFSWSAATAPYVYTIIDNDGADAVTGSFTVAAGDLFIDRTLNYAGGDGNDVLLSISRNSRAFADLAANDTQAGVARAIESLGSGDLYDTIMNLGDADLVQQSFEALAGQVQASAGTVLTGTGRAVGEMANNRMQSSSEPDAGGAQVLSYGPGGPEFVAPDTKLGAVWSSGFGARGGIEGDTQASTLNTGSAGIAAGVDGQFGDWRLGGLAGYSNATFSAADGKARGNSDSYSLGLYGGTEWGDFAFRSSVAYSWHDLSTQRSVTIGALNNQLSARYGAHSLQASGEVSYGFKLPGAASIEPFADLAHVRIASDGYSETGGAAALTNAASVTNTTFTTLGVRASQKFAVGTVLATVRAMVGWEHGMGDLAPKNTSSFGTSSSFTVTGTAAPADTAIISTGLDLNLNDATTIALTYDGRFAKGVHDNSISAAIKIQF